MALVRVMAASLREVGRLGGAARATAAAAAAAAVTTTATEAGGDRGQKRKHRGGRERCMHGLQQRDRGLLGGGRLE